MEAYEAFYTWFLELPLTDRLLITFDVAGAIVLLTLILNELFLWAERKYRASEYERKRRENKKMNDRVDKMISDSRKRRALSSTCAERLTLNQQVPGSNPGGLTNETDRGDDVRGRITWFLKTRTAIAISGNDPLPTKFEWRDLPRPKIEKEEGQIGFGAYRDFREDENKVLLLWDGMNTDKFLNEVVLKQFIIRMIYMIGNSELVPSELLADANLVYGTGDWVDEWGCQDKNDEVIESPREIFRPIGRKLQFTYMNNRRHAGHRFVAPVAKPRIRAFVDGREIPAVIEIPDEKCFYSFRAGGFYEKDQKPLEDACEKGEKAV